MIMMVNIIEKEKAYMKKEYLYLKLLYSFDPMNEYLNLGKRIMWMYVMFIHSSYKWCYLLFHFIYSYINHRHFSFHLYYIMIVKKMNVKVIMMMKEFNLYLLGINTCLIYMEIIKMKMINIDININTSVSIIYSNYLSIILYHLLSI